MSGNYCYDEKKFKISLTEDGFTIMYDCSDDESKFIHENEYAYEMLKNRMICIIEELTDAFAKNEKIIQ